MERLGQSFEKSRRNNKNLDSKDSIISRDIRSLSYNKMGRNEGSGTYG